METEELEKLKKKYAVGEEKVAEISEVVLKRLTFGKKPCKNPVAIMVGGQPGAGKSGLINKTSLELPNAVILDVDDFRYFHPNIDEILKKYPNDLATFTLKFVNDIFNAVFSKLIVKKYNIISQKTLRDNKIIEDTLVYLREKKYGVVIRVLAVHELESKLSTLERSLSVKHAMGFCRWTPLKVQDYAYNGIPDTLLDIYNSETCDAVQVYTRGEIPNDSHLVYSLVKETSKSRIAKICEENKDLFLSCYNLDKYLDAKDALNKNREKDALLHIYDIFSRISVLKQNMDAEGQVYLDELETLAVNYFLNEKDMAAYMNNNIKLELSKEIMARKIALACRSKVDKENRQLMQLLEEEREMNKFNSAVIDKIINVYAAEIKEGVKK